MTKLLHISLKKYPIEAIRYAAYSISNIFWIKIDKISNENIGIHLIQKDESLKIKEKDVEKMFLKELENEMIRQKIFNENKDFRYNIIKKAILYQPPIDEPTDYSLTPEEQKELEKLIREVEEEIKKELKKEKKDDIRKTWEEKYGKKNK